MRETQVQMLGWEDPLEKEMATHSSTLAWEILWTEETGRLQSKELQRVGQDWMTNTFTLDVSDYLLYVAKLLYMEVPPCRLWAVILGLLEILLPGLDVLKISTKQNLTLNF